MNVFVDPTDVNDFQERIEERLGCFEAKTSLGERSGLQDDIVVRFHLRGGLKEGVPDPSRFTMPPIGAAEKGDKSGCVDENLHGFRPR